MPGLRGGRDGADFRGHDVQRVRGRAVSGDHGPVPMHRVREGPGHRPDRVHFLLGLRRGELCRKRLRHRVRSVRGRAISGDHGPVPVQRLHCNPLPVSLLLCVFFFFLSHSFRIFPRGIFFRHMYFFDSVTASVWHASDRRASRPQPPALRLVARALATIFRPAPLRLALSAKGTFTTPRLDCASRVPRARLALATGGRLNRISSSNQGIGVSLAILRSSTNASFLLHALAARLQTLTAGGWDRSRTNIASADILGHFAASTPSQRSFKHPLS